MELESGVRAEGKISTEQKLPLTTGRWDLLETTNVAQPVCPGQFLLLYMHRSPFL